MTKHSVQTSMICCVGLASPGWQRVGHLLDADLQGSWSFCFPNKHRFI